MPELTTVTVHSAVVLPAPVSVTVTVRGPVDEKRVVQNDPAAQAVPSAGTLHVNGPTPSRACMVASVFTPTFWDGGAQLTDGALTFAVQLAGGDPPVSLTVTVFVPVVLYVGMKLAPLPEGGVAPGASHV
jgi:hypothetical protein